MEEYFLQHKKQMDTYWEKAPSGWLVSNSRLDIGVTPSVNSAINSFTY